MIKEECNLKLMKGEHHHVQILLSVSEKKRKVCFAWQFYYLLEKMSNHCCWYRFIFSPILPNSRRSKVKVFFSKLKIFCYTQALKLKNSANFVQKWQTFEEKKSNKSYKLNDFPLKLNNYVFSKLKSLANSFPGLV